MLQRQSARRVAYLVSPSGATAASELWSVRWNASAPTLLTQVPTGRAIQSAALTGDSARVLYTADEDAALVRQLHSIPVGGGPRRLLSGPMTIGGDVTSFLPGPADRSLYIADQETSGVFELYSVRH